MRFRVRSWVSYKILRYIIALWRRTFNDVRGLIISSVITAMNACLAWASATAVKTLRMQLGFATSLCVVSYFVPHTPSGAHFYSKVREGVKRFAFAV